MATDVQETAPVSASEETPAVAGKKKATTSKKAQPVAIQATTPGKKKNKKKKNKPGKYSVLVMDTIRKLGERNGSSLSKIYNESKKVNWFDQQNGRMYLRYSIRALLLNESLIQMKGIGANGSFRLNKKKKRSLIKSQLLKRAPPELGRSQLLRPKRPKSQRTRKSGRK
ncbi:hypothetical protein AAFF_G00275980 [Aldrovandia affinis]|uniref:H15 domain-containing protein n=1 Tax=Aldrovandia affinis TaxID=143900 RepID=A0AAD7RAG4_9TELE|nr:hypothetical protein AAFF_G00275980 [Aldrovandia affinis]